MDAVVGVGSGFAVFVAKGGGDDGGVAEGFLIKSESGGLSCGGVAGAGDFFSATAGDGGEDAGGPGDEPFALHFVGVFSGAIDAEGFAIEEEFDFVGIGVGPDGNLGAGFHLRMGPVGEEVNHGLGGPLGLVEVVEVLFEAGEVERAAHEGAEGPAAVDVASFARVVESGPAEVAGIPVGVAEDFPVLTRGDADHGVVVGGVEDLLPVLALGGGDPIVGKDFFFGEIREGEGILALVREAIAEPRFCAVVATDLPGVRGFGGDEGFVLGTLVGGVEVLFFGAAIDAVDVHVLGAGVTGGDGAGGVEVADRFDEKRGDFSAGFISNRVNDDGGVVAVPDDPGGEVFFPMLVEEAGAVVVGGFFDPAVEDLVHDEEAEFVAEIVEVVWEGVMGGADGIAAHVLEELEFPAEEVGRPCAADGATFPVFADAEKFGDLAIEVEAGGGVPLDGADAEAGAELVGFAEAGDEGIESGSFDAPELWVGDGEGVGF